MAEPASEATLRQLFEVTNAQKLIAGMQAQMEPLINGPIDQALKGKSPNAKQQQAIDKLKKNMLFIVQSEFTWEKFEPLILRLYKETFTEEEALGMVEFYKTPAGNAVIQKLPILMQNLMPALMASLSALVPKLEKMQKEFEEEMKAASK